LCNSYKNIRITDLLSLPY